MLAPSRFQNSIQRHTPLRRLDDSGLWVLSPEIMAELANDSDSKSVGASVARVVGVNVGSTVRAVYLVRILA